MLLSRLDEEEEEAGGGSSGGGVMAAGGAMVAEKASQLRAAGGAMAGRVQEGASQLMAGMTRLISGERQPGGGEEEGVDQQDTPQQAKGGEGEEAVTLPVGGWEAVKQKRQKKQKLYDSPQAEEGGVEGDEGGVEAVHGDKQLVGEPPQSQTTMAGEALVAAVSKLTVGWGEGVRQAAQGTPAELLEGEPPLLSAAGGVRQEGAAAGDSGSGAVLAAGGCGGPVKTPAEGVQAAEETKLSVPPPPKLLVPEPPLLLQQPQQRKVSGGEAALAGAMHELAKLTVDEGEQLVSMKGAAEGKMQKMVGGGGGGPDLEVTAATDVEVQQQEGGTSGQQLAGLSEGEQPPQWTTEARGDCA